MTLRTTPVRFSDWMPGENLGDSRWAVFTENRTENRCWFLVGEWEKLNIGCTFSGEGEILPQFARKKKPLVSRGGRHSLLLTGFFHFGRFFAFLNEENRVSAPYKMWTRVSTLVTKHPPLSTQILKLCCMNIGAMIAYRVAGASKWVVKVAMVTLVILGRAPRYPMVRWELGRG